MDRIIYIIARPFLAAPARTKVLRNTLLSCFSLTLAFSAITATASTVLMLPFRLGSILTSWDVRYADVPDL